MLSYALSLRNLEEMRTERGIKVNHDTVLIMLFNEYKECHQVISLNLLFSKLFYFHENGDIPS
ncbi:hypothetical protein XBJ2_1500002 [Xenorhabdus bovienii str. Jollieti]|uniref:Uncharacterized protein n=1 Tax=Xenorhabdus bovienii (strain SS-2004) TaxID=406818 RepID=D3V7U2_XENBS|nr:hypothetical protein XBJ1_2780 [Xenorhabdus bovienii SS-2004]CDH27757.1 hypothetical protein XBJ2_1500002 [Xenorhabdus bovienii str. Jollieti]